MEVAARVGGGHDAELCAAATGVDLNAMAVAFALGEDADVSPLHAFGRRVGRRSCSSCRRVGRLAAVEGVTEAEALPGVRWARVYRRPGQVLEPLRRGADRAGAVLTTGDDRDEALERGRRAADAVRFRIDADPS